MKRAWLYIVIFLLPAACGPGWEGYEDNYSEPGPVSAEPWTGEEIVYIALADTVVETPLAGLETRDYLGVPAVLLSDLVIASGLAANPESYRYDFTATDGYDLYIKRYEDLTLLPSWSEMTTGYLYLDSRYDDLTAGWSQHPWGSALSAYQVKWMNGGTITLMPIE